ncbi:MAG: restriction endonuclease subunit S [Bacteroidales bacterium]|nr:restriction endonuclease subunit S [Bacteroidales bacterium]
MNNWKKTTLGEVCETNKYSYSLKDNWSYINYLDTGNIIENKVFEIINLFIGIDKVPSRAKRKVFTNDIIYSNVRPIQKHYGIIKKPLDNMLVSTGFTTITVNNCIVNPYYIYYFLTQNQIIESLQSIAEQSVSTYPSIKSSDLESLEINLPPLDEQKRIADVLSALDDKIEINNKINENLEAQAQAIFKQWFVDFEFPDTEGKPYKTNGGEFIDSELGEIPIGWKVGTLTQIASYLNGLAMQKFRPEEDEKGFPVLKIKELRQGCCDSSSDLCSERIDSNYIINNGDIIFSWSGTLMIDFWTGGICGLNQHLFKVESKKYEDWFVFLWTKHHLEDFIRIAKDKAVTMGHIKREHLDKAMVLIPTSKIYNNVNNILKPIFSSIINLRIENKNLSEIRDSLLPKLMSGEVRV